MIQYLIMHLLAFITGLVDSIAGGDGLIALPAYLITGVPTHVVLGTNKLSFAIRAVVSTARFTKRRYLKGKMSMAACSIAVALVEPSLNTHLTLVMPKAVIKYIMILALLTVIFHVLRNKDMGAGKRTGVMSDEKVFAICMLAAFSVGGYDELYGPGIGTFLILILTGATGLDTRSASAQTEAINLAPNIAVLTTSTFTGNILYPLGLTADVCSIAGHYTGAGMVAHDGQRVVRPVVPLVLVALLVKILGEN